MNTELLRYAEALKPITSRVRTDITAIKKDGNVFWTKQSLTLARIVAHLEGIAARGVCPIKPGENTTRLALLDFDSHKGETSQGDMFRAAHKVSMCLSSRGLNTIAFRSSGGKGIHLIMIWNEPQDAYSVRQALSDAIAVCGFKNGTGGVAQGQIEIFPKQDYVALDGYGSQFILPLAGLSEPIDLEFGLELGRDAIFEMDMAISHPVPFVGKPERAPSKVPSGELKKWIPYLYAIDPSDLTYEEWLEKVGFALHYETDGSDEGFDLWDSWSSQSVKYTNPEYGRYKWESIKNDKVNNITGQTLINMARERGFNADIAEDFDDLTTISDGTLTKEIPKFSYTNTGKIASTLKNVYLAVKCPEICGWEICFDKFRDEIIRKDMDGKWWRFQDDDYTTLRLRLTSHGFNEISIENIRSSVSLVAQENQIDSAILWLNGLNNWDGIKRIDTFLIDYLGAEDSPYTRAVSKYMWTAMAGRVLFPGCKADMVPILVGAQGIRKSSAVAALVPRPELFCEISFSEHEDNLSRKMKSCLIAEIGELKGLHSRDLETIKALIARCHEKWVPKFKEFATTYARRLVFIGTTNQAEFLADETGNRRWLPVDVKRADVERIISDRNQLWAEAREYFNVDGIAYKEVEHLAPAVHAKYMIHDEWQNIILSWLTIPDLDEKLPIEREFLVISDILRDALNFDAKNIKGADTIRVSRILRALGYSKMQKWINGRNAKVWIREPSAPKLLSH